MTTTPARRTSTNTNATATMSSKRRYWRRSNKRSPWWPWGILPLAGLLGTFLVGAILVAPRIEADVRSEVQRRLDGQAIATVIESDGQAIAVRAQAYEQDRETLDALTRSAQCDTWAGRLTCPSTVRLLLDEPAPPPPVVSDPPPANSTLAAPTVTPLAEGSGAVDTEDFSAAQRCNDEFSAILGRSTIQFNTSSADINPQSNAVLVQLASVARNCPGTINVEGHTDSRGDASMNLALSKARAAAVTVALTELGIESDRLNASGFGESRPTADNATTDGRASNRRIVISIKQ